MYYKVLAITENDMQIECFIFRGSKEAAIARAEKDAIAFNYKMKRIWAEEIK